MTILPQVQNFSVPPQEMITKDSVTVYVNAIMYYKVFANIKTILKSMQSDAISININQQVEDPVKAVINVDDYSGSAQALAATTLRKVWW